MSGTALAYTRRVPLDQQLDDVQMTLPGCCPERRPQRDIAVLVCGSRVKQQCHAPAKRHRGMRWKACGTRSCTGGLLQLRHVRRVPTHAAQEDGTKALPTTRVDVGFGIHERAHAACPSL